MGQALAAGLRAGLKALNVEVRLNTAMTDLHFENGYGGFWATQILPFGDATSFGGYLEFETALYSSLER